MNHLSAEGRPGAAKFIVLFSDGQEMMGDARTIAQIAQVPIHAVHLDAGGPEGADLMRDVAALTDGILGTAATANQPHAAPSTMAG